MEPFEEFFEFEKSASSDRSKKDMRLWEQWNNQGRKEEDMRPLLKQFKPLIYKRANVYAGRNPNVPPAAVRAEFTNQAIKGFETYNPTKGAALGTHVNWQMMKGKRFIATYGGGVGRIPETRSYQVQTFMNARDELSDVLGRDPTAHEMADKLKWPIKQVSSMELEVRKEVPSSKLQSDMTSIKPSRTAEVVRLIQYEITPEEKIVMEHLLGVNGKPQMRPGEIAKKYNMTPSKVSRIKTSLGKKMGRYVE